MFGELLFPLPPKFLIPLVYFGLYKFVLRMETNLMLTVLVFQKMPGDGFRGNSYQGLLC